MSTQEEPAHHSYENVDPLELLKTCLLSGTSNQVNQTYKTNSKSHGYEDTFFRYSLGNDYFYAVLDGHDGSEVAHFSRDTLVKEFCRSIMLGKQNIAEVLEHCISNVDKHLHERIMPLLEERADIKVKIAGTNNSYEAYQAYPDEIHRLGEIEDQIKGGTTVAVAVIHENTLYVANVGDSRVILCTYVPGTDSNVEFKIDQLTEDHTTANDNELDRLSQLGLNRQQIQTKRRVGSMETTRSIGDFAVKWGYKDFDILSGATGPPVISKPHVTTGLQIDKSFYFLFLMSDGVYHAVEEMSDCSPEVKNLSPDPNIRIAYLLHDELKQHRDCQKAADNVLEYICKSHFDSYSFGCNNCCRRDDMTLTVRLFNNPNKLYGHKRNHSGTIFRSSFSFCSTSSGDTTTPQPRTNDLVDMISSVQSTGSSGKFSMPPLTLTHTGSPLSLSSPLPPHSPAPVSPSQVHFRPDDSADEPYIKLGDDFPDDVVMKWIIEELGLPENITELLDKQAAV
ncbi:TGF-beta-activated kinase 1 and MAP3K7-binding protein 1-like isoform X2 [Bolinopsis microptera]|uniref:TGF-beta-activated kinase 1 and MAP3K7-binding protein 1-like isoform X2 n=1 Tax=Bolinopsis microptera TaxID=2820187 RepID=UPI003078BD70